MTAPTDAQLAAILRHGDFSGPQRKLIHDALVAVNDGVEAVEIDVTSLEGRATALESLVGLSASPTTTKLIAALDRILATTTVASTTTETTVYTKSVDHANFNGYVLRLTLGGEALNNTAISDFFTVRVKLGATTIATVIVTLALASSSVRGYLATLALTSRSASVQRLDGTIVVEDLSSVSTGISRAAFGAAAESTSGAGTKTLAVTVQPNTNSANLTWTVATATLERL